jgi:hypothetical protein
MAVAEVEAVVSNPEVSVLREEMAVLHTVYLEMEEAVAWEVTEKVVMVVLD